MIVGESAREYVAIAKILVSAVKYDEIEVPDKEIRRGILISLLPAFHLDFEGFARAVK